MWGQFKQCEFLALGPSACSRLLFRFSALTHLKLQTVSLSGPSFSALLRTASFLAVSSPSSSSLFRTHLHSYFFMERIHSPLSPLCPPLPHKVKSIRVCIFVTQACVHCSSSVAEIEIYEKELNPSSFFATNIRRIMST